MRIGNVLQPTIGTNTFIAQGNGQVVNLNLVLGVDSDNDGLPDDWERLAILNSGGAISTLAQIGPGTDLDGDGIPDDQEFRDGTFPFLADDLLRISSLTEHANGRLSFSFTPIENLKYWVDFKTSLDEPEWIVTPISLTETGPLTAGSVSGGNQKVTLFFEPGSPTRFWRLRGIKP